MSTAATPSGPDRRDRAVQADEVITTEAPRVTERRETQAEPVVATRAEPVAATDTTHRTETTHRDVTDRRPDPRDAVEREKARFGGMHFFLAFFGWLTATGMVVLLSAVLSAVLAGTGVQNNAAKATSGAGLQTASAIGIAALAAVLFIGYYCGGYVAGRMARFSGAKQGLAVWLWAVLTAILVAIAGAVAGSATGAFSQLNASGLPISGATASPIGIAAAIVAVVFSLGGALLGGIAGTRYHRKVDRVGFGA